MKKNKPRYKKGRVKKSLKRVNKRVGGFSPIKKAATEYDPTKGYKKGQIVDAGEGAIFKAKTDVKAGTAGLGNTTRWERVTPAFQPRTPVNTMQGSPNNRTIIEDPQRGTTLLSPIQAPSGDSPIYTSTATPTDTTTTTTTTAASDAMPASMTTQFGTFVLNPNYDPTDPESPQYLPQQVQDLQVEATPAMGSKVTGTEITEAVDTSNFLTLTDTESGTEYTFDPDLYPPGYRSLYNINSGNDYSTAPPFPLLKDFKTYAEYKKAFDAHSDGPYQDWIDSFPKSPSGVPILPKLNAATGTVKTTTSNQNVNNVTTNTSNEATQPRTDLGTIKTTQDQEIDDKGNVTYSAPRSTITPPVLPEAPMPEVDQLMINPETGKPFTSTEIKILQDISAGRTAGANPAQQRLARERLAQFGITAEGAIEQMVSPEDAVATGIAAPTPVTEQEGLYRAATLQGLFPKSAQGKNVATTYAANQQLAADLEAAKGVATREVETTPAELSERAIAATRAREDEQAALATGRPFIEDPRSQVQEVTGEQAIIQATQDAVAQVRFGIEGDAAPDGEAAKIELLADIQDRRNIQQAKQNILNRLEAEGISSDVARQLSEDPASLATELDRMPDKVKTTLSGLTREALISTQLDSLLQGIEDGETPVWARPAIAAVESNLAKRGLQVSTVGRDALVNAIIQSAIPLAQQNAQAIQNATSQDKTIAGQFLIKNAEFQQQMELANLSNDQQMRLANLSALNAADKDRLTAAQQTELANLQTTLNTNLTQGKIAASMNQAQLGVDQQTAVTNALNVAKIDLAKFSTEQQIELANSKFMQTSTLQDFTARQQAAISNATNIARMDIQEADLLSRESITNANNFLKLDLSNLNNEQQEQVLNAQLEQQANLSNQAAINAARQFGAVSQNQIDQFMTQQANAMEQYNASQFNSMQQFNATEANRIAAINAGNTLEAAKADAQLETQISQFNAETEFRRNQWNSSNAQAVEQSNVEWRRQANTIETAAQNAANQANAQMAYGLSTAEQAFLWQNLRDEAAYIRTAFENEEQRKVVMLSTALQNEAAAGKGTSTTKQLMDFIIGLFGTA